MLIAIWWTHAGVLLVSFVRLMTVLLSFLITDGSITGSGTTFSTLGCEQLVKPPGNVIKIFIELLGLFI